MKSEKAKRPDVPANAEEKLLWAAKIVAASLGVDPDRVLAVSLVDMGEALPGQTGIGFSIKPPLSPVEMKKFEDRFADFIYATTGEVRPPLRTEGADA